MQDYQVNADVVNKWWVAAVEAINHHLKHIFENNSEEAVKANIINMLNIPDLDPEELPDGMDLQEFKDAAIEEMMKDPMRLMFGKMLADFTAEFMRTAATDDFREIPGTEIKISILRNEEGVSCGTEISRRLLEDPKIAEIANNGISNIEEFLNNVVTKESDSTD